MTDQELHDPDWHASLTLPFTPNTITHALFYSATAVHTGWTSCINKDLVLADLYAVDDPTGNYCRLAEQEFTEEGEDDVIWHDWTVELRIAGIYVAGHWQIQSTASMIDWEWCAKEAETAFERGCVLMGKRVRRSLVVEEAPPATPAPKRTAH